MTDDHPDEATLRQQLKGTISGFQPTMTGGICDTCNGPLSTDDDDTDYAYVYADWHGDWHITRTSCQQCGDQLDERELVEAIVKCELGESPDGQFYPLYNPEIVEMNTSDGAVLRR